MLGAILQQLCRDVVAERSFAGRAFGVFQTCLSAALRALSNLSGEKGYFLRAMDISTMIADRSRQNGYDMRCSKLAIGTTMSCEKGNDPQPLATPPAGGPLKFHVRMASDPRLLPVVRSAVAELAAVWGFGEEQCRSDHAGRRRGAEQHYPACLQESAVTRRSN